MSKKIPNTLRKILKIHHKDSVQENDCLDCSSACCSYGGFAILENVIQIYSLYKEQKLVRYDYEFPIGLSFKDFVFKYFDVMLMDYSTDDEEIKILFFHMRSLSSCNNMISIPFGETSYWDIRDDLFDRNDWLNHGCIFLNRKVPKWPHDDGDSSRKCILHDTNSNSHITSKPIDCVFFTCLSPIDSKVPDKEISKLWFETLAVEFRNSEQRFNQLLEKEV